MPLTQSDLKFPPGIFQERGSAGELELDSPGRAQEEGFSGGAKKGWLRRSITTDHVRSKSQHSLRAYDLQVMCFYLFQSIRKSV